MPLPRLISALLAAIILVSAASSEEVAVPPSELDGGPCSGHGVPLTPPPNDGPPFKFSINRAVGRYARTGPDDSAEIQQWKSIGYRYDEKNSLLIGPDGEAVTEAFVAWMHEPVDLSRERLDTDLWHSVQANGYRLEEKTCRWIFPGGPVLTHIKLEVLRTLNTRSREVNALEDLSVSLKGIDASQPVPSVVLERTRKLASAGAHLPADIEALLSGGRRPNAGEFRARVDAAYAASTRFFDGSRDFGDLISAAVTTAKKQVRSQYDRGPEESRLGQMLAADLQDHFSKTSSGRELLDHFRDKKGGVRFPEIIVMKDAQSPDFPNQGSAKEIFGDGLVIVNYWTMLRYVFASIPVEQRKNLKTKFTDSRALRTYLEGHSEQRMRLVDSMDEVILHELIHTEQTHRDVYEVEVLRHNAPNNNPLSGEYEAHRGECRYLFEKTLNDPLALTRSGYSDHCLAMLRSYDSFRDGIQRQYLSTFAGTQSLLNMKEIQASRKSLARRLMGQGWDQFVVQGLKLLGMHQGDKALEEFSDDAHRRERVFTRLLLPQLRERVAQELPERYLAMDRPELALRVISALPEEFREHIPEEVRNDIKGRTAELLIKPPPEFDLNQRLDSYRELSSIGGPIVTSVDISFAHERDSALYLMSLLDKARDAVDLDTRKSFLSKASRWAKTVPTSSPAWRRYAAMSGGQ